MIDRSVRISSGVIAADETWQTVRTSYWYPDEAEMVVLAQPIYDSGPGGVVRIRNVANNRFEIKMQNPAGQSFGAPVQVCWLALPSGRWATDDIKFEARRVESTSVSGTGSFQGESLNYQQAYDEPVVLGQVMTTNDDRWSVFWSHGVTPGDRPSATSLSIGRHVGADPVTARSSETLGIVVFEQGTWDVNGITLHAGHTGDAVVGLDDDAVYAQPLPLFALTAFASSTGMDGGDGAWPVLAGDDRYAPFSESVLRLVVDEDTITDAERSHTTEEVAYLALNADRDSSRFIAQATFGGYFNDFRNAFRDGYAAWIDAQKDAPISLTTPYMDELNALQAAELPNDDGLSGAEIRALRDSFPANVTFVGNSDPSTSNFPTVWMRNIVKSPDQLRQRVAWCLSQILVISGNFSALGGAGASVADFYDLLSRHALGNYRTLLKEVSVHPAMAYYLSSLGNQQASPDGSRQPDENYAREVMQLFSIGLWELNNDGTQKLDAAGEPIPNYDNDDITNLARVFTGLWYDGVGFGAQGGNIKRHQGVAPRKPLAMFEDRHDRGPKVVFPGKPWVMDLPGNQDGIAEMDDAIDALIDHPSTPPFIARRLIQFLVTSNPSPGYVGRVSQAFINNGQGERGDLHATVRQVLLDYEARAYFDDRPEYGKVMEPMVRLTRAVKAFRAGQDLPADDIYFWNTNGINIWAQFPMFSPSVFNFFDPDFAMAGDFRDTDLFAPELQILNPVTAATGPNEVAAMIDDRIHRRRREVTPEFRFDFTDEIAAAPNTDALINRLDILLCRGQMSAGTRSVIASKLDGISNAENRVKIAVWIALQTPEAVVLR